MSKVLEQALREIQTLSEHEKDAAAGAMLDYVRHMREISLSDAQVAEVHRRRTDPHRKLVSHEDARKRISRLGSEPSQ